MSLTPEQYQYFMEHASDNLQPNLVASAIIGLVLAYILVALRIHASVVGKSSFGIDGWLIVAALAPLTSYAITVWLAVSFGEGKHIIFVTNVRGFIHVYVAAITGYALCVVLTKISILCFYRRIFSPVKSLQYASWALGIFIVAYNLALILVTALQCIPLSSLWTGEPAKCIDTLPPFTVLGVINVVTDFLILVLPVRQVLKLRLSQTRRIQLSGIFLLGALVCVFGIIRVVFLATAPPGDPSYNQTPSGIWSFCEIAFGIVAACLPTIANVTTRAHLSKVSNSMANAWSRTFTRSHSTSGIDTKGSDGQSRTDRGDRSEFTQLSELSLRMGQSGDSMDPLHQGHGNMSSFAASSASERGERNMHQTSGIVIKKEIIQVIR